MGETNKNIRILNKPAARESTNVNIPLHIPSLEIVDSDLTDKSWELDDINFDKFVKKYPHLKNDKYILEFFEYDYAPRFKRENGSKALPSYVDKAKNIYKETPIYLFKENSGLGGFAERKVRSYYNNFLSKIVNPSYKKPSLYLNKKYILSRPVIIHELTHIFRQSNLGNSNDNNFSEFKDVIRNGNFNLGYDRFGSGYSSKEKYFLNRAYNLNGYDLQNPLFEKGTTNTEVRFRIWKELYDKLRRRPTLSETDNYIRNYDKEKLRYMIRDANAYGDTIFHNGLNPNYAKDALIHVAQNDTFKNNNDYINYAKQGKKLNIIKIFKLKHRKNES